jgi:hypothetical protein
MHTNVLGFHNTWEEHEAINLRISVDFKLETLKFANEHFENTKYKIPKPCLTNTSPNMQKLEFIQVPTTNKPCKKIMFCSNHLTKQG